MSQSPSIKIELKGVSKDGKFVVDIFNEKQLLGTIYPTPKGAKILCDHFSKEPLPQIKINYETMDSSALSALLRILGVKAK